MTVNAGQGPEDFLSFDPFQCVPSETERLTSINRIWASAVLKQTGSQFNKEGDEGTFLSFICAFFFFKGNNEWKRTKCSNNCSETQAKLIVYPTLTTAQIIKE